MKKIIAVLLIALLVWLNTYRVNYSFIREQNWKNYESRSDIFKDVIIFKNKSKISDISVNDNGIIYRNDTSFLGKIIKKKHDYVNTYITVLDSNNDQAIYIAK